MLFWFELVSFGLCPFTVTFASRHKSPAGYFIHTFFVVCTHSVLCFFYKWYHCWICDISWVIHPYCPIFCVCFSDYSCLYFTLLHLSLGNVILFSPVCQDNFRKKKNLLLWHVEFWFDVTRIFDECKFNSWFSSWMIYNR